MTNYRVGKWSTMSCKENVRDLFGEAKKECGCKEASFRRRHSVFQSLIEGKVQESVLKGPYENLGQAYEALDKAHKSYLSLVDEATIRTKGNYLRVSLCLYSGAKEAYSRASDRRERAQS